MAFCHMVLAFCHMVRISPEMVIPPGGRSREWERGEGSGRACLIHSEEELELREGGIWDGCPGIDEDVECRAL